MKMQDDIPIDPETQQLVTVMTRVGPAVGSDEVRGVCERERTYLRLQFYEP